MKVIDLLNKIANGEEVPISIKWGNTIYYLREDGDIDFYSAIDGYELMDCLSSSRDLREEVEIIEEPQEHKIPEKICTNRIINTRDIL